MPSDMYIKIDGIDGESVDADHEQWIGVLRYTHGVIQPVSAAGATGGRTGGHATFNDFVITKTVDSATVALNIHACNGKHIPEVEVHLCLASEEKHVYMKYILSDVIVSSVVVDKTSEDGALLGTKPTETVSFAYGKIKWDYTAIDDTGAAGAADNKTWNVATGKQE